MIAALVTYAGARADGVRLVVHGPRGDTAVPLGAVVAATVVGIAAAWVVTRLAARTGHPRTVFAGIIGTGLVLSSLPPATAAVDGATTGWLLLMHFVVAAPLVTAGWRALPERAEDDR